MDHPLPEPVAAEELLHVFQPGGAARCGVADELEADGTRMLSSGCDEEAMIAEEEEEEEKLRRHWSFGASSS